MWVKVIGPAMSLTPRAFLGLYGQSLKGRHAIKRGSARYERAQQSACREAELQHCIELQDEPRGGYRVRRLIQRVSL